MNRISLIAATALALVATVPAYAEKSDRIMVQNMRSRIMTMQADLPENGAGSVELAEAESRLRDLSKALDDNESADARASVNGIEALIAAARVRADAAQPKPQAAPVSWTPAPVATPRKRISHRPAAKPKRVCRIASR